MRAFLVATIIALLTATAYSQGMGSGQGGGRQRGGQREQKAEDPQKKKRAAEADKAYKSAIDSLPDQKFDPWKNMR